MQVIVHLVSVLLILLAIGIPRFALPHAHEFRWPGRFRRGIRLLAAGVAILGVAPVLLYWTVDNWNLRNVLLLVVLTFSFGMIGSGLHKVARANIAPRDDIRF
jgi:hypothetical protein